MIWTNKGLKNRIAELEEKVSSLKQMVKALSSSEVAAIDLCNAQHDLIKDLEAKVKSLTEIPSNVVESRDTPRKPAFSFGQEVARRLRGIKP